MGETLGEKLQKVADVLFWLGKNEEAGMVVYLRRYLEAKDIHTDSEFLRIVEKAEDANTRPRR